MKVCGDFRWDKARQALAHAQYIAEHYSKDPRTKVGAPNEGQFGSSKAKRGA